MPNRVSNKQFNSLVHKAIIGYFIVVLVSFALNAWGIGSSLIRPLENNQTLLAIDGYFIFLYVCIGLISIQSLVLLYNTKDPAFRAYCFYITAVILQVFFYEELYLQLGVSLPEPWRLNMRQSTGVLSLVLIFQFARILLNSADTKLDIILRLGIVLELISAIGLQLGFQLFFLVDILVMAVCGTYLIISTSPIIRKNDPISHIFCISFLCNFVGFFFSAAVFINPDTFLQYVPYYNYETDLAGRAVWITGLTLEALLVSLVAHIYFFKLKGESVKLASQSDQLAKAVAKAKSQIRELENKISRQSSRPSGENISIGLRKIIETHAADKFLDVSFLCKIMAMSNATLSRKLKKETGMTPVGYIRIVRLELAKKMIEDRTAQTVSEAANACGFSHHGHFSKHYLNAFGVLPAQTLAERKT